MFKRMKLTDMLLNDTILEKVYKTERCEKNESYIYKKMP